MVRTVLSLSLAALLLAGCGMIRTDPNAQVPLDKRDQDRQRAGSIFGEGGLSFGSLGNEPAEAPTGIGVNSFLWRATLDTVSFMPLVSADPFGGVIITDWYAPAETPGERFKINAFILDRQLRADGIRVSVFRQTRDAQGGWIDAPTDPETATGLENAVLTRARELRLASGDIG